MLKPEKNVKILPIADIDEYLDHLWYELGNIADVEYQNQLMGPEWDNRESMPELVVELARNPDYLHFVVRYVLNIDLLPYQVVILQQMWNHPLVLLIATRGGAKSFILSVYLILRCLLHQGCKFAVVGAALRQSLVLFQYVTTIWSNAPILRDICGGNKNVPKRELHAATWKCGLSNAMFLPMGTGDKIRGLRANYILSDEIASISPEIFETVVRGFAAVKSDGLHGHVVKAYKAKAMRDLGLDTQKEQDSSEDAIATSTMLASNQIIMAGTAHFQFNHTYKYYKYYRGLILSGGSKKKLKDEFPDMPIPDSIRPQDYTVIRIPYKALPPGMMDETILSQGQATMDPGIFQMEYGACGRPGQFIITDHGCKLIENIVVGDMVLTHKGRFRKVTKKTFRYVDEPICKILANGSNCPLEFTDNHPFWVGDDNFVLPNELNKDVFLSNLSELNGKSEIDIRDWCLDYSSGIFEGETYVYPAWRKYIKTDIPIPTKYKSCILPKIKLDYDFGLILGYYASEGSIGADGRAVGFALDGHVDVGLDIYIEELEGAIQRVFGLLPKKYDKKDNTANITINHRLITELISNICPGTSINKFIRPEVLFSNPELMRGFIIGYWHGDGHIRKNDFASATSISSSLLLQVKLCLSYFDIGSGFHKRGRYQAIFRGQIYNTSQAYNLNISGNNFCKFTRLFGIECEMSSYPGRIVSQRDFTACHIRSKEMVPYSGIVYNFEVEEDNSYSLQNATVHNCFPADSEGFYLASQIRAATAPVQGPDGDIRFGARLYGDRQLSYVMGLDPASESDNFAINIVEIGANHNGVVYQWSTNRKLFEELQRIGGISEDVKDYNTFTMCHIRSLMKRFNIVLIVCDTGGGGLALRETFKDPDKVPEGDMPVLDMDDENTERMQGKRILKMIEFSNYQWRRESHYALKKDIMDKRLIFPAYDLADIEESNITNKGASFDTLEDCYLEIEQCKSETMMIRHTMTGTGQEKWDVPKLIGIDAEEVRKRLKKDRFTSLLLSNWGSRLITAPTIGEPRNDEGVLAQNAPQNVKVFAPCIVTHNPNTNQKGRIFY